MTPNEIMSSIKTCTLALQTGNAKLKTLGINLAKAKSLYRIALAKKQLYFRKIEKYPANLVYDMARGDEEVARLGLIKDIAQVDYDICLDSLRNTRSELEALRSLLTWERVELKNT